MKDVLHLHLKAEYFDAIQAGTKKEEYRRNSQYWCERLLPPRSGFYREVWLYRGYPKRGDESRILKRKYKGVRLIRITHPEFGKDPIQVFAIDVSVPV